MKKPTLVENRLTARRQADPLTWTSTPVRLERTILRDLKVAAVEADTTVNNLILEGIRRTLALHQKRMARNGEPRRDMTDWTATTKAWPEGPLFGAA